MKYKREHQNLKITRGSYHQMDNEEARILKNKDIKKLMVGEFTPDVTKAMCEGWELGIQITKFFVQISKNKCTKL